jgi:hypothetical protein
MDSSLTAVSKGGLGVMLFSPYECVYEYQQVIGTSILGDASSDLHIASLLSMGLHLQSQTSINGTSGVSALSPTLL